MQTDPLYYGRTSRYVAAELTGLRLGPVIAACDHVVIQACCSEALAELIPGARLALEPIGDQVLPVSRPAAYQGQVLPFLPAR